MNLETTKDIDLSQIQKDTLARLEWSKITESLSQFAIIDATKERLKALSPWNNISNTSSYYKECTMEVLRIFEKGAYPKFENFKLDTFAQNIKNGALLSGLGLYQIFIVLKNGAFLKNFFDKQLTATANLAHSNLSQITLALKPHTLLIQTLQKSIDDQGSILPEASLELAQAHKNYHQAKRKINENLDGILKNSQFRNVLQENTWMLRDGRYVLPVKMENKNSIEGIARGISQTGSTIFIEPKILASEQAALEKAELEIQIEEHKVLKKLSQACHAVSSELFTTVDAICLLDEMNARAQFASVLEATPCEFLQNTDRIKFSFLHAKHPLFLLEKKHCIENTLELGFSNVWVLSGPNAGGKTVVLKTVGVYVLLAKCGLFVPASKATCLDYEHIFVELGDRQNREEDLSTFSGHLEQIKKIIHFANEKSLILLDEGFVGTDPAMGVALARSVLEYLAQKKSTVIITTHFSSLKTLASENSVFANASMEFEPRYLCPTYRLLNGIPGQSYALELCERMGMDSKIIEQARNYYGREAGRMESILKELQEQKRKTEEEIEKQKQLSLKTKEEFNKIQEEQKSLQEIKNNLVEEYRIKLQKRLNAFTNRLEIRERQFLKHQEKQAESLLNNDEHSAILVDSAVKPQNDNTNPRNDNTKSENNEVGKLQKISIGSFEELAKLKLNTPLQKQNKLYSEQEKFRQPKQFTSRALLDEAQESLENLHKSYDKIEKDLEDELSPILNFQKESKEKAKHISNTLQSCMNKSNIIWKNGMRVKTDKFKEVGIVLKEADSKGFVECQFGIIKLKIPAIQLLTVEEAAKKINHNKVTRSPLISSKVSHITKNIVPKLNLDIPSVLPHKGNSIDLRGKTVDDALSYLEQSLDKMERNNVNQVVIIHGHGTGKVKEAVRQLLEKSNDHFCYRPGRAGEGGDGVTILDFDS